MTRKKEIQRLICLSVAVFWMALIFHFSDQKADASAQISGSMTYRMVEEINQIFHLDWEEGILLQYAEKLEHPVRKAAHMTEYAILAVIFVANCMQYPRLKKRCYVWAQMGATFYAATDEFHQLFIEGRSGEFKDVCIDSTGALIGLLVVWGIGLVWGRRLGSR